MDFGGSSEWSVWCGLFIVLLNNSSSHSSNSSWNSGKSVGQKPHRLLRCKNASARWRSVCHSMWVLHILAAIPRRRGKRCATRLLSAHNAADSMQFHRQILLVPYLNCQSHLHQIVFFNLESKNFVIYDRSLLAFHILLNPFTRHTWCASFVRTTDTVTFFLALSICKI